MEHPCLQWQEHETGVPIPVDVNKTAAIVLKLVEPLLKPRHNTQVDNFQNLPILVRTVNVMNKTNCNFTLKQNRKYVTEVVKICS